MVYFVLTVLSAVIFTAYVTVSIRLGGILPSLSESYYLFEQRKKGRGMVFYSALILTIFTAIFPMCEIAGGFGVLAGFALLLVGAAPTFKEHKTLERVLHVSGAFTAAATAVVILAKAGQLQVIPYVAALFLVIALASCSLKNCRVLWAEMVAFYALFAGMFIYFHPGV